MFEIFVKGGDGTKVDSISFALTQKDENKEYYLSIINEFLSFIPHQVRIDNNFLTVSDFLNLQSIGRYYYEYGNGFSFTNMSTFMVLFDIAGFILCLFSAWLYTYLFKNIIINTNGADSAFLFLLILLLFVESISMMHWVLYACALVYTTRTISNTFLKNNA
jgi:hypothetical protein